MSLKLIETVVRRVRVASLVTAVAVIGAGGAAAVTVTNVADIGSDTTVTDGTDPGAADTSTETSTEASRIVSPAIAGGT